MLSPLLVNEKSALLPSTKIGFFKRLKPKPQQSFKMVLATLRALAVPYACQMLVSAKPELTLRADAQIFKYGWIYNALALANSYVQVSCPRLTEKQLSKIANGLILALNRSSGMFAFSLQMVAQIWTENAHKNSQGQVKVSEQTFGIIMSCVGLISTLCFAYDLSLTIHPSIPLRYPKIRNLGIAFDFVADASTVHGGITAFEHLAEIPQGGTAEMAIRYLLSFKAGFLTTLARQLADLQHQELICTGIDVGYGVSHAMVQISLLKALSSVIGMEDPIIQMVAFSLLLVLSGVLPCITGNTAKPDGCQLEEILSEADPQGEENQLPAIGLRRLSQP